MQKNKTKNITFMATLQKLRNMGPLLVIFVGLALLAFIAGDAVKLFDTHSIDTSVGTVGDKDINVMDFQEAYNEFDCLCNVTGLEIPEEARQSYIWSILSNSALYNDYAAKLGITVTAEEVNHVLVNGKSDFFAQFAQSQSPFHNGRKLNLDYLTQLTEAYQEQAAMGQIEGPVAVLYNSWKFLERGVILDIISNKINTIAADATIANPAVAQKNFDLNNNTHTVNVALYPFNRMDSDSIPVTEDEVKKSYKENLNSNAILTNQHESRDIKYILKTVEPSEKDLADLKEDMTKYADTLKNGYDNYQRLARISRTTYPYINMFLTKELLDPSLAKAIDTLDTNEVLGPVDNTTYSQDRKRLIKTYDVYKNIEKAEVPESFMIRAITVAEIAADGSNVDVNAAVDSLINILNNGADFKAVASNYRASFDSLTIHTSNANEVFSVVDDIESQKDIYNAPVGKYLSTDINVQGFNGKMLFQLISKEGKTDAYHAIVIRREKVFSNETYNREYENLCKFVGKSKDLAELEKNAAEDAQYWVRSQRAITTDSTLIAGTPKTSEFIDWIFDKETNVGQISGVKKCGNEDCFMVIALENINEKGDKPLTAELAPGYTVQTYIENIVKSDKATENAIAEMKDKSYNDLKSNPKISTYTVDRVEFNKPASVSSTMQDEIAVSAVAAKTNVGETSAPFKGINGVYVVEVTAKDSKNGTFDAATEKQQIETLYNRFYMTNAVANTLDKIYPKANRVYKHF